MDTKGFKIFKALTIAIVVFGISTSAYQTTKVGRDKAMIHDCRAVLGYIGNDSIINICPKLYSRWSLHGYFSRYANVSLERDIDKGIYKYYLAIDACNKEYLEENYNLVPLEMKKFTLYELK
ncbi:MAG: hypothetical protein HRT72_03120 [Flavobacteriales bacterium]|nr:hypothetical protein [Flavobacteriales bacterium]